MPLFWDPIFHEARKAFIQALGARYAGNPNVVGVLASFANYFTGDWAVPHDIRMIGGTRINQVNQWLEAGYTTQRMLQVGQEILDATAAAFPNQAIKLPIGVTDRRLDGSATALAELILAYAYENYPTRFYAQFNALNTGSLMANDPLLDGLSSDDRLYLFELLKQHSPQIGLQNLAAASNGDNDNCRQNASQSPCPAQKVLQQTVHVALSYHPTFLEFWDVDAVDPELKNAFVMATLWMKGSPRIGQSRGNRVFISNIAAADSTVITCKMFDKPNPPNGCQAQYTIAITQQKSGSETAIVARGLVPVGPAIPCPLMVLLVLNTPVKETHQKLTTRFTGSGFNLIVRNGTKAGTFVSGKATGGKIRKVSCE